MGQRGGVAEAAKELRSEGVRYSEPRENTSGIRHSVLSDNRAVRGFPRNLGGSPRTVVVIAEANDKIMHDLEASLGCGENRLDF